MLSQMPLQSSEYWLLRAEEARAIAENMNDQFAKQSMMEIVAIYQRLAQYAQSLENKYGKTRELVGELPDR